MLQKINQEQINQIFAVIDNGTGMPEGFLHTACKIGGTHRPSADKPLKRRGYGRFAMDYQNRQ